MKRCVIAFVLVGFLTTSCTKQDKISAAASSSSQLIAGSTSEDLHPDPGIVVRPSPSEYEETLKIPADWDGSKYCCYTFNCPSSSIERLLEFLHWNMESGNPKIVGSEYLPEGRYFISFSEKKWEQKEDVIDDVILAVEVAFQFDISFQETQRTFFIRKKTPNQAAQTTPGLRPSVSDL